MFGGNGNRYFIGDNGTGSGHTEVHVDRITDGTRLLDVATPWPTYGAGVVEFGLARFDSDQYPDLFQTQLNGTGSGLTEEHVLAGYGNFQTPLLDTGIAGVAQTTTSQWQWVTNRPGYTT